MYLKNNEDVRVLKSRSDLPLPLQTLEDFKDFNDLLTNNEEKKPRL